MVPITTFKDGNILDLTSRDFYTSLIDICAEHKKDKRALAFAFILYNQKTPQVIKMLNDNEYWDSLNVTSGKFLSIFYIIQPDNYFAQDLKENNGIEMRDLYAIRSKDGIKPILKRFFNLDKQVNLPAVLFFQVTDSLVSDYFLISLDERNVEESFWELQDYIQKAVDKLEGVEFDINHNSAEIFYRLKNGVTEKRIGKQIFKLTQKFPIQLLAGWLTSKI